MSSLSRNLQVVFHIAFAIRLSSDDPFQVKKKVLRFQQSSSIPGRVILKTIRNGIYSFFA